MGPLRSLPLLGPSWPRRSDRLRGPGVLSALALLIFAATGCGDAPRETRVLAHYDFSELQNDPIYGLTLGNDRGLHAFTEGWAPPKGKAVWTLGERAAARFTLVGSDLRLRLRWATSPVLVQRDQEVTLRWNGEEILRRSLPRAWQIDTLEVALPDAFVRAGTNELEILADQHLTRRDGESLPRAVYVYGLEILGDLDAAEMEIWRRWTTPAPADPQWSVVHIPADPDRAHLPTRIDFGPDQPDLLMVVLDAARADHFSGRGYARSTTPSVDALAAEGVSLANMLAEAPYTRSSVATLFTGYSWRDHGVWLSQHALSPEFTTLAEVLQEAGYFTLGVTDNANVARSAGSDQGFDEWVQTWSDVQRKAPAGMDRWWPELPEILWRERLGRGLPDDRPVFAFVHLMPPHEPYFPGPDHDLFGPEDYDGPIQGTTPDIQAFDRGEYELGGSDHQRLVALYDGGLHRGDAILARVLEAWRATGRSRPTLTVFLSDHGEAFGEHAKFGHNSTPHDEMLHVPFVMHPAGLVPEALRNSPDRLRSLGDALPLILHSLRVPLPRGTAWPSRVVSVLEDPSLGRNEVFIRCSQPIYARRTRRELTVLRLWGTQEHFIRADDPRAERDLRWQRPDPYLEALGALRAFLEFPEGGPGAISAELSPEDIARLEALGYL